MPEPKIDVAALLACPDCGAPLSVHADDRCYCPVCEREFGQKNGVPVLFPADTSVGVDLSSPTGTTMVRGYRSPSRLVAMLRKVVSSEFFPGGAWRQAKAQVMECSGPILVVGSGATRYPSSVHLDLDDFPGVDVIGDARAMPFREASFEGLCCEVVLEHIDHPEAVIAESQRVLRPGGWCFFILPFVFPYHGHPGDYHRWTRQGIQALFGDFVEVSIGVHGGPCSGMVNLLSEWAYVLSGFRFPKGYVAVKGLATAVLFPIKFLDVVANRLPEAHRLSATFFVLAQKRV